MRVFSKFVFLCNVCFVGAVIFRYYEFEVKKHTGNNGRLIPLDWLQNSLVILGYGAVIVNTLFLLICFIFGAFKVKLNVPGWILVFNILAFAGQAYYFFFT